MTEDIPRQIKVELIAEPCINATADCAARVNVAAITTIGSCWMDPIIEFLAEDKVLDDESEANKICQLAPRYWLSADRKLYRRSFGGPYLLCLHPKKVNELRTDFDLGAHNVEFYSDSRLVVNQVQGNFEARDS